MAFRLAVLCALLAVSCGLPHEKVTGGEEIEIEVAPWTCSIEYDNNHIGGGAIVSRVHVLTAASAVDELPTEAIIVRVGTDIMNNAGLSKAVANVTVHPEYNRDIPNNNDIALIRLRFPLSFGETIRAIPIAVWTGQGLPENGTFLLTGFQLPEDDEDTSDINSRLQFVVLQLVRRAACAIAHGNVTEGPGQGQSRISENMFCAVNGQSGGNSACAGSNGSPAVLISENATALVGLASWSNGCGADSAPGVFTIVSRYFEWLRSVAGTRPPQQPRQIVLN